MMEDTKFSSSFPPLPDDFLFNFTTCDNENLPMLNSVLHNFEEVDVNEYCCTVPMENGRVVDLNHPQTPEKDQENHQTCTAGSVKSSPTGIIPCQDEFGGCFNFEVMLDTSSQSYRQKWNYSVTLQKLFIDIDKVLLLNFKYDYDKININCPLFVRALPMYSAADHLKDPVDRCLQHLSPIDKLNQGFAHLEHVIRCDNESTSYHLDEVSKRKSVVTLLTRPENGADSTRLSYRFVCKTSCLGGMQRRPIIVIFTLEDYIGQVHGRRVLPIKICSCPKRDMEREEKDTHLKKNTVFRRNKRCTSQDDNVNNNNCHHRNDFASPCKMIKVESSSSLEPDSTGNNVTSVKYTLPISYVTNNKKNYKKVLESIYVAVSGVSSLNNIQDTEPLLKDLKSKLGK